MSLDEKIKRNSNYLKILMVFICLGQIIQIYQSVVFEVRNVISIVGILILFTGFLLTPVLLVIPIKPFRHWFNSFCNVSIESNCCFILGLLLVLFSGAA